MEETAFDKIIHKELKGNFGDNLLKVSTNYGDSLGLLYNHLEAIYGKAINCAKIVEEYMNDSKAISSVEDIEEVSENFIHELIKIEDEYQLKIERLHEINSLLLDNELQFNNEKSLLLNEAINLIGLNGNESGLLSEIIDKKCSSFVANPKQFRSLYSALSMIINEVSGLYSSGMQLSFPNTNATAMIQTKGRCFYRGENAYYKSSKASCYRGKSWSKLKEPGWDYVLWRLRLYECFGFFDNFDVIRNWRFSDVNKMAIAQHYGFKTPLLDITTNLKTALFFACCKPDKNGVDWHPLTKDDFEEVDSREDVESLGGDSRYAILYYVPTNIVDCKRVTVSEKETSDIITPIGYQPFMRCSTQYGYMMNTTDNYDLMQDKLFRKIKFRLTEELCNWIYEEMDCGKAIYPNDKDIARIQDIVCVISNMNDRMEFSKNTVEKVKNEFIPRVLSKFNFERNTIIFYSTLNRYGIKIKDRVELLTNDKIQEINKLYTIDKIENRIESPKYKPMIIIGGNNHLI